MKIHRLTLDLLLGLLALLALAVPLTQLGAAAHVAATESNLARRYIQVCNAEGTLCTIKTGEAASQVFGRLLPGS